jgi:hypothetical protein
LNWASRHPTLLVSTTSNYYRATNIARGKGKYSGGLEVYVAIIDREHVDPDIQVYCMEELIEQTKARVESKAKSIAKHEFVFVHSIPRRAIKLFFTLIEFERFGGGDEILKFLANMRIATTLGTLNFQPLLWWAGDAIDGKEKRCRNEVGNNAAKKPNFRITFKDSKQKTIRCQRQAPCLQSIAVDLVELSAGLSELINMTKTFADGEHSFVLWSVYRAFTEDLQTCIIILSFTTIQG